ncbi:hypothetical protein RXV86_06075 [Alisedimentitalea sp. MJ-SS2]|uniref:hypothetical protein n=1 Tax=Aliisedimentitalea sp. MJ-SS2 TaxID=3049795 RepID=UPI00290AA9B2|nr:hypothetical protein [Alisedimentitalea sp. MJ-SS2]MDU8926945.1 hypothetical protein [Alisedimentitalea sp. MJ-SS2]
MFRNVLLSLAVMVATPAAAQEIPLVPLVPPELGDRADAANIDLNGVWEFATSNHTGGCPGSGPGFAMAGLMEIAQSGGVISMEVVSGAACDPASMCSFTGEIAEGDLILWNSDTVDDEGGKVTNTLHLVFQNNSLAQGVGGSLYVHPKMSCTWGWSMLVHRPEVKDGEWTPGAAGQDGD